MVRQNVLSRRNEAAADLKIESRHLTAEAVDISEHGVCLTLTQPVEVGTKCQLNLTIERDIERRVFARVCFCLPTTHGFRVGLNCSLDEFIDGEA